MCIPGVCCLCPDVKNLLLLPSTACFVALKIFIQLTDFPLGCITRHCFSPAKNSILKRTHLHFIITALLNTVILGGRILFLSNAAEFCGKILEIDTWKFLPNK